MRILQWLILALPWVFVPRVQHPFGPPKEAVLCLGMWAVILTTVLHPRPQLAPWRNPHLAWLLLWVLAQGGYLYWWLLLQQPPGSEEMTLNFHNWIPTVHVLTAGLFLWVLATYHFPRKDNALLVAQWLCWSGALVSAYCLGQRLGFDQFFNHPDIIRQHGAGDVAGFYSMIGASGNVNYVVTYLAPLLPLYLIFRQKRYLVFGMLPCLVLLLSHSTFAVLAATIGLGSYAWLCLWRRFLSARRVLVLLTILLAFLGMVVALNCAEAWLMEERWGLWVEMVRQLRFKQLTGLGLGNFYMIFHIHWDKWKATLPFVSRASAWQWAHNDLLQWGYELGAIGFGLLCLGLWRAITLAWEKARTTTGAAWLSAGLALGVTAVLNFPFHLAPSALTGLIILAMWHAPQPRGG